MPRLSPACAAGQTAGRLAGTVTSRQERKTKSGGKIGIVQLSDASGQYEVVLFTETLINFRDMLEPGASVIVTVSAEDRPEGISLRASGVQSLEVRRRRCRRRFASSCGMRSRFNSVRNQLRPGGDSEVSLILSAERRRAGGRDRPAGSLSRLAADRQRDQGGAGRRRRRTGLTEGLRPPSRSVGARLPPRPSSRRGSYRSASQACAPEIRVRHQVDEVDAGERSAAPLQDWAAGRRRRRSGPRQPLRQFGDDAALGALGRDHRPTKIRRIEKIAALIVEVGVMAVRTRCRRRRTNGKAPPRRPRRVF